MLVSEKSSVEFEKSSVFDVLCIFDFAINMNASKVMQKCVLSVSSYASIALYLLLSIQHDYFELATLISYE